MNFNCEQVEEDLPAFAVDALASEERLEVIEHLAECRRHDTELAELRATVARLPLTLPPRQPPALLRSDLMAAFNTALSASASLEQSTHQRPDRLAARLPFWRRPSLVYGLFAVLVLAVLGLASWTFVLQSDSPARIRSTSAVAGGASLNVTYVASQGLAVLSVDLPAPPAGHTYQGWKLAGDEAVSLGLLSTYSGPNAFRTNLADANAVAVSLEPEGGSPQPTTTPLLVARF